MVPVLVGLDRAASEHSPAAEQSDAVTVTYTDPVSTGIAPPCEFVVKATIPATMLAVLMQIDGRLRGWHRE